MLVFPFNIKEEGYDALMQKIAVSDRGAAIMRGRFALKSFMISDISTPAANVVKQQVLALGGEAAVPAWAINCGKPKSDLIFALREDKLPLLTNNLKSQCWKLPQAAEFIEQNLQNRAPWFNFSYSKIDTGRPNIMGILNATPDSFSDGGEYDNLEKAIKRVSEMVAEGADIIDVGGESTRPNFNFVDSETEIQRVIPLISEIKRSFPEIIVSIDTTKSEVAEKAVGVGAEIINDISGLTWDKNMASLCSDLNLPVIINHNPAAFKTTGDNLNYENIFVEILNFFDRSAELLLSKGFNENRIIVDPGIGFAKTLNHNLAIFKHFEAFHAAFKPILVGCSRKSMIGAVTGNENPLERVAGTVALNTIALEKGAAILRVHDIKEARETLKIHEALKESQCF